MRGIPAIFDPDVHLTEEQHYEAWHGAAGTDETLRMLGDMHDALSGTCAVGFQQPEKLESKRYNLELVPALMYTKG